MKKILSFITALFLISSSTVLAAPTEKDFKEAIEKPITYADIKMELKTETGKLSEEASQFLFNENQLINEATVTYDISFESTSDLKQINAEAICKSEGSDATSEQYFMIDLTGKRPYFLQLIKTPELPVYMAYEFSSIPEMQPFVNELKKTILSGRYNNIEDIFGFSKKAQVKKGKYVLELTEQEFKEAFPQFMNSTAPLFATSITYAGVDTAEGFKNISEALKDVKVFADIAFESSLTLDKENNPDILSAKINFDTNLNKLLNALKSLNPEIETENLTEQNSDLKLSLFFTIDFDNINKEMKVKFPDSTAGNIYNITNDFVQQHFMNTLESDKVNVYANNSKVFFTDAEPVIENDRTLVPLRKFLNSIGVADDDIVYEEGYITITYNNTKTVKLNVFDTNASVTENGKTTPIILDVSAKMVNDRTLVPLRFLSETFDCEVVFQELDETTSFINVVQRY